MSQLKTYRIKCILYSISVAVYSKKHNANLIAQTSLAVFLSGLPGNEWKPWYFVFIHALSVKWELFTSQYTLIWPQGMICWTMIVANAYVAIFQLHTASHKLNSIPDTHYHNTVYVAQDICRVHFTDNVSIIIRLHGNLILLSFWIEWNAGRKFTDAYMYQSALMSLCKLCLYQRLLLLTWINYLGKLSHVQ